jgi:ABC-type transport system involved in cytochrome c biogenesis permease subunit
MKRLLLLPLLLGLALAGPLQAEVKDASALGRLPVLEGGRVMPLDTLARMRLLQISGRSTFDRKPAIQWLARLYFTPELCHDDRVFLVDNPEVLEALDVPREKETRDRYSYHQLEPVLDQLRAKAQQAGQIGGKDRSPFENGLLSLYHNINSYMELFHGFNFALPHEDFTITDPAVRTRFDLPADRTEFSFLDVYQQASQVAPELDRFTKAKPETWTAEQRALYDLSSHLYQWGQMHRGLPPAILPMTGQPEVDWVSPWDLLSGGFSSTQTREDMKQLGALAGAFRAGRQVDFNQAALALERSISQRVPQERGVRHLNLELLYNRADFFYRSELLYGFAFLASLLALLFERRGLRRAALALVVLALLPHTVGIISRMIIMGRPPVTNLYATFVFVGWICVLLGLAVEWFQRNALGTLMAALSGLGLLLVSGRFDDSGDSMGVMIAVLDSNFWLATHVVTITIGYAGCVAAGLAGHVYLLLALMRSTTAAKLKSIARAVYGLLAFGLVFSFLGTMLGGVWADQSWGRFWGWDPKENGALLIVLWCAFLFHARIGNWIGDRGMAAGSVLGVIIVLMAWLGINLLGVGLHSYGFTSGLSLGFWTTVAVELLFVAATLPFARRPDAA